MKDLDSLADRVRLHRQGDSRNVVIVEGVSDKRILQRSFSESDVVYFPAGSRPVALEAAKKLTLWRQEYFICVVDRDFDDEVSNVSRANRKIPLHPYDNADLEGMLTVAGAAGDLVSEFGSADKIKDLGGAQQVLQKTYSLIEPISRLRRANYENNWGLAFDRVEIASKIDRKTFALKVQSYCAALDSTSDQSPGQAVLLEYAKGTKEARSAPKCPRGTVPYFRGRDFLGALSAALCGYCGSRRPQSVEPEHLASILRLAGSAHLRRGGWGEEFMQLTSVSL
ncbi:DUF4435 domain-containing protein [Streptomyces sp. NBC_01767]|uniref:DUF4435 domain-containing protein n=1 Tax=Streptomyces sp. NBC_01767 TaxID=2975937 RepID=UPI00224F9499|nr:DUF4435 domain-containing protein [Streptomyces sp. NBC_01767]MCX4396049.1 DUF4435 domain-containing protein [Streptomyces sp. NBC_01767]